MVVTCTGFPTAYRVAQSKNSVWSGAASALKSGFCIIFFLSSKGVKFGLGCGISVPTRPLVHCENIKGNWIDACLRADLVPLLGGSSFIGFRPQSPYLVKLRPILKTFTVGPKHVRPRRSVSQKKSLWTRYDSLDSLRLASKYFRAQRPWRLRKWCQN